MKKLTVLAALLAVSIAAYAGPYFAVEQNLIAAEADFVGGYSFNETIGLSALSLHGDAWIGIENLWVYPWALDAGVNFGFSLADKEYRTVFEFDVDMEFGLFPGADVDDLTLTLTGYPTSNLTIYGAISFWPWEPVIGLECEW